MTQFLITLAAGIVVLVIGLIIASYLSREKNAKKHFAIIWRKSPSLKLKDVLGAFRSLNTNYYKRDEDELISENLNEKKSFLVVGPPLSGKTRSIHHALSNLTKAYDVLIPRHIDIDLESFIFPEHVTIWRDKVVFIDDLHLFVELTNFDHLLKVVKENNITLIGTCRSGIEFNRTSKKLLGKNLDIESLFDEQIIKINHISNEKGKEIAKNESKDWNSIVFDGTIGSIFMPLKEMEKRFSNCTEIEKTILLAIRNLHLCGLYEEDQLYPLKWIKTIAKENGVEGKDSQWDSWLRSLKEQEFIALENNGIRGEEVYIENIIKPQQNILNLTIFEQNLSLFSSTPKVLIKLGDKASEIGDIDLDISIYMRIAIAAYQKALKVYILEKFPMDYGMIQNNLGIAYRTLAEVENKADNCRKSITAFEEALKVRTLEKFPMDYGMTQNNLGNAYRTLADVEDKADNCRKSITAFEEALKVRTLEKFPMDYGMTQNNLGNAYGTLAEVEDKADNCRKSITAFEKALKVYALEKFPMDYGMIQNNLGTAYGTLADVEDKADNCRKSITAYEEALKVYILEKFPRQYGMTQNNLGSAYQTLAEVEDNADNCRKSITACEEALKVRTLEKFPMQYGNTQNNLGNAYQTLADVEDKADNCRKSITACEEALKVRTLEKFPMDYGMTQNNLGSAYQTLAEVEDKADNCRKSITAFEEVLKVYTKEKFPDIYDIIKNNLRKTINFCNEL